MLTLKQVEAVRERLAIGMEIRRVARETGVSSSTIATIRNGTHEFREKKAKAPNYRRAPFDVRGGYKHCAKCGHRAYLIRGGRICWPCSLKQNSQTPGAP